MMELVNAVILKCLITAVRRKTRKEQPLFLGFEWKGRYAGTLHVLIIMSGSGGGEAVGEAAVPHLRVLFFTVNTS